MAADYTLKTGDLTPSISATLIDAGGDALDIEGVDVTFIMTLIDATEPTVERLATNLQVTDGTDGSKGKVRYDWVSGDTEVEGGYRAEWQADFAEGPGTFPNQDYSMVAIIPDLGGGS